MTSQEKAKEGVRLLKEAVLETVRERPAGAADVERRLGIESCNPEGNQQGWLAKSILWLLERDGEVEQIAPRQGYRATGTE